MAFQAIGLNSADVLKESHLKEFSAKVGVNLVDGVELSEDEGFVTFRSNHPIMRAIDLARTTLHGPRWAYNNTDLLEPFYHFEHIFKEYENTNKPRQLSIYKVEKLLDALGYDLDAIARKSDD